MDELKVGDKVALCGGDSMVQRTVARVLKRFVELNDGTKWNHAGSVYPKQEYSRRFIRPMSDELESKIHRLRQVRLLKRVDWASLGDETLAECLTVLAASASRGVTKNG